MTLGMLLGTCTLAAAEPVAPVAAARSLVALAFSSVEFDSRSGFSSSGGKLTLGLGPDDFAAFVQVSAGSSITDSIRARRGRIGLAEVAMQARVSFGLQQAFSTVFLSGGVGPSLARVRRKDGTPAQHAGVFAHADMWHRPDETRYLAVSLAADSAERSLWMRVRQGWKLTSLPIAAGPELAANLMPTGRKLKAGLHIGDLTIWRFNIELSGGVMWDRRGFGQYATLATWIKY